MNFTPDAEIYAWAKTQNRGIPPWDSLSPEGRAMWRVRFYNKNPHRAADEVSLGRETDANVALVDQAVPAEGTE